MLEYHLTSGGYLAPGHVLDDISILGWGRDYYVLYIVQTVYVAHPFSHAVVIVDSCRV